MNYNERNKQLANAVKEILIRYGIYNGTCIYFNNTRLSTMDYERVSIEFSKELTSDEKIKKKKALKGFDVLEENINPLDYQVSNFSLEVQELMATVEGDNSLAPFLRCEDSEFFPKSKRRLIIHAMEDLAKKYDLEFYCTWDFFAYIDSKND